ncbi:MAG TPA: hypothetical protein VMT53_15560 [Terriglobales bacterium]|nr:hypothetical protein [Terriglobales bacterium]
MHDPQNLVPTAYLYDGPNLMEEVDASGNVLAQYTEGGLDEPLTQLRSGVTSYYEVTCPQLSIT